MGRVWDGGGFIRRIGVLEFRGEVGGREMFVLVFLIYTVVHLFIR